MPRRYTHVSRLNSLLPPSVLPAINLARSPQFINAARMDHSLLPPSVPPAINLARSPQFINAARMDPHNCAGRYYLTVYSCEELGVISFEDDPWME